MVSSLSDLIGTSVTVIGTILLIALGRLTFKHTIKDKRSLPYHRQILTLLLSIVGSFVAVAFLPISTEVRSQILSVLGILLSAVVALSSSTFVGNAMAGITLRVMKGFRAGDFIQVDDLIGRVTDMGLFHTEMQLVTRDIVTVPNQLLIRKAVHVTRRGGTFVNTSVSLGYGVPHAEAEEALREAAENVELTEPFVLIEGLLDHAVEYRVYGLLEKSSELLSKTSQLRRAVLDALHGRGIEIASPSVVDRRELGTDHRYIPDHGIQDQAAEETNDADDEEIEEIAFDRAEEAESIEQLYSLQEKLNHEMKSLAQDHDDSDAKTRRSTIQNQLEQIGKEIEKREEEREKQRLEENTQE